MWVPLGIAFWLLAPPVRPAAYDAIQVGMTGTEIESLLSQAGYAPVIEADFHSERSEQWRNYDGDLITLHYRIEYLKSQSVDTHHAIRILYTKGLILAPLNPFERLVRKIRRMLGL
jgi:hypothetical protein